MYLISVKLSDEPIIIFIDGPILSWYLHFHFRQVIAGIAFRQRPVSRIPRINYRCCVLNTNGMCVSVKGLLIVYCKDMTGGALRGSPIQRDNILNHKKRIGSELFHLRHSAAYFPICCRQVSYQKVHNLRYKCFESSVGKKRGLKIEKDRCERSYPTMCHYPVFSV